MRIHRCPVPGCGLVAEYLGPAVEEIVTKNVGRNIDISTLMAVQTTLLIDCPVHGKKYVVNPRRHHIDTPGPFQGAKVGGGRQTDAKMRDKVRRAYRRTSRRTR